MKRTLLPILPFGLAAALTAVAQSTSASYQLFPAPPGAGGGPVSNGSTITGQVSVGGAFDGAVSSSASYQLKASFIGQLYEVVSVTVAAVPATIDEGGMRQLTVTATLDDLSMLAVAGTDVQWSVVLGPLTGIDAAGVATADIVYEDSAATVEGTYQDVSDQLGLTVLNVNPDDFGSYGGDGLDDSWQVGFFGAPPNANAAPGANPDNDPDNNLVEFLTGYDPTDSGDFFTWNVIGRSGTTATLELSKIVPGTRYRVERSQDLDQVDPWAEFTDFTTGSEIPAHLVNDPNAIAADWFYRILVEQE